MTHLPERTQMDMRGASESVAPAVHNAPHHVCSRVYDDLDREMWITLAVLIPSDRSGVCLIALNEDHFGICTAQQGWHTGKR